MLVMLSLCEMMHCACDNGKATSCCHHVYTFLYMVVHVTLPSFSTTPSIASQWCCSCLNSRCYHCLLSSEHLFCLLDYHNNGICIQQQINALCNSVVVYFWCDLEPSYLHIFVPTLYSVAFATNIITLQTTSYFKMWMESPPFYMVRWSNTSPLGYQSPVSGDSAPIPGSQDHLDAVPSFGTVSRTLSCIPRIFSTAISSSRLHQEVLNDDSVSHPVWIRPHTF